MHEIVKFKYNEMGVRGDDERRMLNLTDMWRADGADPARRPANWARKEGRKYIEFLAKQLNVPAGHIIFGEPGRTGSTWAIAKIALAYGQYLSLAFQDHCLGIILAVYQDGGYVQPGREDQFLHALQEQAKILVGLATEVKALREWRDTTEKSHPYGTMGKRDAKVLAGQFREIRNLMIANGDNRKLRALNLIIDRSVRAEAAYPKEKGKRWQHATSDQAMRAFAYASQWISGLRDDLKHRPAPVRPAPEQVPIDFATEKSKRG